MISLNPKDWLLALLGLAVAILGALALFFRGNAAAAKERLKDRNLKAAEAQRNAVTKANARLEEAQKKAAADEARKIQDAMDKDNNPFNDPW